jgi:hypothetical protein
VVGLADHRRVEQRPLERREIELDRNPAEVNGELHQRLADSQRPGRSCRSPLSVMTIGIAP